MSESSSSSKKLNEARCPICNFRLRSCSNVDRKLIKSQEDIDKVLRLMNKPVEIGDILCAKCNKKLCTQISLEKKQLLSDPEPCISSMCADISERFESTLFISDFSSTTINNQSILADPTYEYTPIVKEMIEMPFSRPIISHCYCFICSSKSDLKDIPIEARLQVFLKRRILVPKRNRCCKQHLMNKWLYEDEIDNIKIVSDKCELELSDMAKFMDLLAPDATSFNFQDKIDKRLMPQCQLYALTGHNWKDIDHLQSLITSMRNTSKRTVIQAIVTFLCKLRTGNANRVIAAFAGLDSERQAQSYIDSVLKSFEDDILPNQFGLQSITRDFIINERTSPVAKKLFDCQNRLMIICDGTYIRHQKSSNNVYQRKSYSGHKKTTLCKPFTICTTDGFVIDIPGPFNANENDASILKNIIGQKNGLSELLQPGDYFVLDRGFRDVVPILKKRGFNVLIPALKGKNKQLTTKESNESRLVTKIRWVVEAVHGVIGQKYKLLHNQFQNKSLPKLATYCRIACFLHNKFGKKFNSDSENMEEIINSMKSSNDVNSLAEMVEQGRWNTKRSLFKTFSSDDALDFPRMSIKELKIFFTGSYQLSQAISYLAEMLKEDGTLSLKFAKESNDILQWEVQSRHINRKKYKCYIKYLPKSNGLSSIVGHCCTCANGNRTVGCCSHVAALIYHLSYGRYLSRIFRPAEALTTLFDFNEEMTVIESDSDND
ncbi:hypothetical protein DERF_010427 [Dermatophagoides farinae]|uniref:SWIM-type domain-containing protein n=1 Tax=Dermatophagoides farinae TaxID=6954 RepID=A0A922I1A1_DERFA|nr:hypothetical protein DERF_010427 [Dermatophagoides farinae]